MYWIVRYLFIIIWGNLLKLFFLFFPINKKTIVFVSFSGTKVSCNPFYLYKYINSKSKDLVCYWILNDNVSTNLIPKEKILRSHGYHYHKILFTAGFIITNDRLPSYFLFRKKQTLINTWHGGGAFKRTFGYPSGIIKWFYDKTTLWDSKRTRIFLSSSLMWSEVIARTSFMYRGEILESGFPRNDLFFVNQESLIKKIREKIGIGDKYDVILYAPTYRNSEKKNTLGKAMLEPIDVNGIQRVWKEKYGKDCVILFRGHHAMKKGIAFHDTIDVSTYSDMQELLLISDAMISDYSSCMWDYALTKRPCFIYAPDFEDYLRDPGFESDYHQWPFYICKNNKELLRAFQNVNQVDYEKAVDDYLLSYGSYEKGCASKIVYHRMLELVNQ